MTFRPFSTTDPFPAVKSYTLTPSPGRHSEICSTRTAQSHLMDQLRCCCSPIGLYWSSGIFRFFSSLVNLCQDIALQHMQMCTAEDGYDSGLTPVHLQHVASSSVVPACSLMLTAAVFSCPYVAVGLWSGCCLQADTDIFNLRQGC